MLKQFRDEGRWENEWTGVYKVEMLKWGLTAITIMLKFQGTVVRMDR